MQLSNFFYITNQNNFIKRKLLFYLRYLIHLILSNITDLLENKLIKKTNLWLYFNIDKINHCMIILNNTAKNNNIFLNYLLENGFSKLSTQLDIYII